MLFKLSLTLLLVQLEQIQLTEDHWTAIDFVLPELQLPPKDAATPKSQGPTTAVANTKASESKIDLKNIKVEERWFESVTNLYSMCKRLKFEHPVCPAIDKNKQDNFPIKWPKGDLNSENLLAATGLYLQARPPLAWLIGLKLGGRMPSNLDPRLWAEAQYLYAKVLFDQKKFKESVILFDRAVDYLRGKALFHQERAWAHFFAGEIDRSLGSLFSALSPLIHPTPYFEKYFLRALIERETCQWEKAFTTIALGRVELQTSFYDVEAQPFVALCDRDNLGETCQKLRDHFKEYGNEQIRKSLVDLDLLEMEMRDRGVTKPKELATSKVIWPFVGEAWQDEVGFYRVKVESKC